MKARFYESDGVEYVSIELDQGCTVNRKARQEDRDQHTAAYLAFKAPDTVSITQPLPVIAESVAEPEEPPLPPEPPEEKEKPHKGIFAPRKKK